MQHDPDSNALTWLLSMLNVTQLGSSIPSVHNATTVDLLCKLLSEDDYVSIAGRLKKASDAKNLLDFMLHLLHERGLSSPDGTTDLNQRARRSMIKIISKMPVMPSSLFVTGVTIPANREYIGGGGFGNVLKGELKGEAVALKVLYKPDNDVAFCREALMWRSLDHNLVLPFLGIHEDDSASQLFLVSPYMRNGTLAQWRKKANPSVTHIEERILELAHGIEYIHSEGIVHGDLRGANILLDDELHVQIADFGLTRLSEATNTQSGALHLNFAAPELFGFSEDDDSSSNDTPARTQMSDVYAFGCLYYEIHFDSLPFAGKQDMQIWNLIFRRTLPPRLDEPPLSDGAWDTIQRCWIRKPSERPRIKDVAQRMMALYRSAFATTNVRNPFYYEMLRKLSLLPSTSSTDGKDNGKIKFDILYSAPDPAPSWSTRPFRNLGSPPQLHVRGPRPINPHTRRPRVFPTVSASDTNTPTSSHATSTPATDKSDLNKLLIVVTADLERYVHVDITGAKNAAFIRECIFNKLKICRDEEQAQFSIYKTEIGDIAIRNALTDDQLFSLCRDRGDSKGSLKFLIARTSAVVHEEPVISSIPPPVLQGLPSSPVQIKPRSIFRHDSASSSSDLTWAPRPPPEDVYDRLEDFFPEHDLDKPVIEAGSGSTSAVAESAPSLGQKRVDRKSSAYANTNRNTKLWGSKIEETTVQPRGNSISSDSSPSSALTFKWIRGELIGKGTYGRVYLALNTNTGEMMAVKQVELPQTAIDRNDSRQTSMVQAVKLESETLKELDHPHIVQYLGFEETLANVSIFFEYIPGGSVASCLLKHGRFEENVTKSFTYQILDGLDYLHSKGILHRDLKADNILVEMSGICKISGFEISKRTDVGGNAFTAMQGTVFWMAPEVINTQKKGYNFKVDIWSVGCVVLEMWTGKRPWTGEEVIGVMFRLYQSKLPPPVPDDVKLSEQADHFRMRCFAIDPEERATAAELMTHPYLKLPPDWHFISFT